MDLDSVYNQTLQRIKEQKGDRARLGVEVLMRVSRAERPLRSGHCGLTNSVTLWL